MNLILLFLAPQISAAYITPTFQIIHNLSQKHNNIGEVQFKNKISLYKKDGTFTRSFTEFIEVASPHNVIARLGDENGNQLARLNRKMVPDSQNIFSPRILYYLLLVKNESILFDALKALGIPLTSENDLYAEKEGDLPYKLENFLELVPINNTTAIVIGNRQHQNRSQTTPQIWVDRVNFLPLKAVIPENSIEILFLEYEPLRYRDPKSEEIKVFQHPKLIKFTVNEQLWIKIETQWVKPLEKPLSEFSVLISEPSDSETKNFVTQYIQWIR